MFSYYIKPDGSYYEGDREHPLDQNVPQRPDHMHDWNGSAWVPNAGKQVERQRLIDFDSAIGGDANLQAFKTITKNGFDTWWAANVTNAAQAIAVLKKLAWLVVRKVL